MTKLLFSIGVIAALSFQTNAQSKKLLGVTFKVNKDHNYNFAAPIGEIDDAVFSLSTVGNSKFLVKYENEKQIKSVE